MSIYCTIPTGISIIIIIIIIKNIFPFYRPLLQVDKIRRRKIKLRDPDSHFDEGRVCVWCLEPLHFEVPVSSGDENPQLLLDVTIWYVEVLF